MMMMMMMTMTMTMRMRIRIRITSGSGSAWGLDDAEEAEEEEEEECIAQETAGFSLGLRSVRDKLRLVCDWAAAAFLAANRGGQAQL